MSEAVAVAPHGAFNEEHERAKLGTWLFLASEIMFFAGFIGAFVVLKVSRPEMFHAGTAQLNKVLAAINTVVLICSSFTMVLAVMAAQRGDTGKLRLNLFLTILLAFGFLVIKYFEYTAKFDHGIGPKTSLFYATYFTMTGFHGLHVVGGIIALGLLLIYAKKFGPNRNTHVECVGLYWHFVDIVWIFLFPLLYLMK